MFERAAASRGCVLRNARQAFTVDCRMLQAYQ
jgi:hypothetical protein